MNMGTKGRPGWSWGGDGKGGGKNGEKGARLDSPGFPARSGITRSHRFQQERSELRLEFYTVSTF